MVGVIGAVSAAVLAGGPPEFEISRYTIDGGGVMFSTSADGVFELSGTIGQPDAGTMAGGDFELHGGFWFPVAPNDCNEDGGLNLFDYSDFEACLTGPGGEFPTPGCSCFDQNGDEAIDLNDFALIQSGFSGH